MKTEDLKNVKEIFERVTGERVYGICVQGAKMKGVADAAADHDIFVITAQTFDRMICVYPRPPHMLLPRGAVRDTTQIDTRRNYTQVGQRVSMELGVSVSFSVYDIRSVFRGLFDRNPFTTSVLRELFKSGLCEISELEPLIEQFASKKPFITEFLFAAGRNISLSREDLRNNLLFRSEKKFTYAMWNLLMAAATYYDVPITSHDVNDLADSLIDAGIRDKHPEGLSEDLLSIISERTTRVPGSVVSPLIAADYDDILKFHDQLETLVSKLPEPQPPTTQLMREANNILLALYFKFNKQEAERMLESISF